MATPSCLENPMDGGAWCRLLSMRSQRVGKQLSDFTFFKVYSMERENKESFYSGVT